MHRKFILKSLNSIYFQKQNQLHIGYKSYPESSFYFRYLTDSLNDDSYYRNLKSGIVDKYQDLLDNKNSRQMPTASEFEFLMENSMKNFAEALSTSDNPDDAVSTFLKLNLS